jgi:DNA mismatch repair ATPase MutS
MENPKLAKGIVKREVVEVVSPGYSIDKLLDIKTIII